MDTIQIVGRVNEREQLEFEPPADLPPGEVRITIEAIDPEADAADEAFWDKQFAESQDVLERLSQEAQDEYLAGLTDDFIEEPSREPVEI